MLKPEILDPQGQAIANALPTLGFSAITAVRQGKRFEVEIDGEVTDEVLAEVTRAAGTLLSNPVIEDFAVSVDGVEPGAPRDEPVAEELATVEASEAEPAAEPSA
jgi:phosphoribosylformylglycinamidine synthase